MDIKAFELLKIFQTSDSAGAIDTKLRYLNDIKSDIKHKSVPDSAIANIFEVIRRSIASSASQQLMILAFSTLSNFLKRLHGQNQTNVIGFHGHKLFYNLLVEKLSDQRDSIRTASAKAFAEFWLYVQPEARFEIEHNVIQNVLASKNARPKVVSLQWLSDMVKDHGLKFRSYVPLLINCLEDADGSVRETAKSTVLQLFKGASSRAIGDLTKQLRLRNVRKTISDSILAEVTGSGQITSSPISSRDANIEASLPARPHTRAELQRPNSVMSSRQQSAKTLAGTSVQSSGSSLSTEADHLSIPKRLNRAIHHAHTNSDPVDLGQDSLSASTSSVVLPPIIKTNDANIEPLYVDTSKQLDELIMSTRTHFEGRESEHNWTKREESIALMRRITKGNGPIDHRLTYVGDMYIMVEGILKASNSLRTTLSTTGCELIQEMCKAVGHGIDSMVETLLLDLTKLCAGTKKISANNANNTVDAIVASATINHRVVNYIWQAVQDKNVAPRSFAAGWLKTLMRAHRLACNRTGCLELIEKSIKKGLEDANPGVRSSMRGTYWTFAEFWPEKAQSIMASLDAKSQNLLQQDPSNPNQAVAAFSKSTNSRPDVTTSRRPNQSLKDAIANSKKQHHQIKADDLPSRPASAMSVMMENKPPSRSAVRPPPVGAATTHSVVQSGSGGSLLSAPMRPPIRPTAARKPESQTKSAGSEAETVTVSARVPRSQNLYDRPGSSASTRSFDRQAANSPSVDKSPLRSSKKQTYSPSKPKKTGIPTSAGSPAKPKMTPSHSSSAASTSATAGASEDQAPRSPAKRASMLSHVSFDSPRAGKSSEEEFALPSPRKDRPLSGDSTLSRNSVSHIPKPVTSHSRHSSEGLAQPTEPIKVYEDPFVSGEALDTVGADNTVSKTDEVPPANVLEDLPINPRNDAVKSTPMILPEGFVSDSPLNGQGYPNPTDEKLAARRWQKAEFARPLPIRPRSRDRSFNQDTLKRFIEGIRSKSIDVMGFRKLQGIIVEHDSIFEDEVLFDDMLLALFGLLESPNDTPKQFLGRIHDQKESALSTVKLIFEKQPKYATAYYARALSALIVGRQYFDSASHIVAGFETLINIILRDCTASDAIDAVLDILTLQEDNEATDRSMIMGAMILDGLLAKLEPETIVTYEDRLTEVARNGFQRGRPAIRRAMVGYARTLGKFIKPEARFFSLVAGGDPDLKSLLTYYMNLKQ